ncbi:hypothetical protein LAG90_18275 [Marinilongibacter aquaticus]|uniref:3-coathanger stack domain-containing protein n=1 Tax=Marinilongibacter aquaticus TaxID=2975157 RepID=UPI0021BD8378|nr:3-coathanger stack domain-containing protein [Marinilongibacter aquaticus]UBM58750.1 hypothetical protein LAG90_18275 [Marinilongibacter aquaticus]
MVVSKNLGNLCFVAVLLSLCVPAAFSHDTVACGENARMPLDSLPVIAWKADNGAASVASVHSRAIARDGDGHVLVCGSFQGTVDFGGTVLSSAGRDPFVAKYTESGGLVWVFGVHCPDGGEGQSLKSDEAGNVYAAGDFAGTLSAGGNALTSAGGLDIFVLKLGPAGDFQWLSGAGGTDEDHAGGIAVSGSSAYLTGQFAGSANFGGIALNTSSANYFLAKTDAMGGFQWARQASGATGGTGFGVAVDNAGDPYGIGSFEGTATFGTSAVSSSDGPLFFAKYHSDGSLEWVEQIAGDLGLYDASIAIDGANNIYVGSDIYGAYSFKGIGMPPGRAAFLLKMDADRNVIWESRCGGTGTYVLYGLDVGQNQKVAVTGGYRGGGTISMGGSDYPASMGKFDVFVACYGMDGGLEWGYVTGDAYDDNGQGISVAPNGPVFVTGLFRESVRFGDYDLLAGTKAGDNVGYNMFVARFGAPPDGEVGPDCPENLTLTGTVTGDRMAGVSIESSGANRIPASARVAYRAGQSVSLAPGFVAETNAVFIADIYGGCR